MFTNFQKRFISSSCRVLAKFKVYPPTNSVNNRALVDAIAESNDQSAFFAWHPKKEFPYEYTRPLPTKVEQKNHSLLKQRAIEEAQVAWKLKHPEFSRAELMKITSTTKHRWFPRSRDKKMNYKKTPMERPYL